MPAPFYRTIKQAKNRGFIKTAMTIIALTAEGLLDHLQYLPEISILKVNKAKMMVLPKKGVIHADLFVHKKREPICTDYLINCGILKKGDIVLEIGANIGYYVLVESELVGRTGQVSAVEPVASNFMLLENNVRLNNLSNVSTYQYAFGDRNKVGEIFVSDKSNLCAMHKEAVGGEVLGVQNVSVLTVDEFIKDKPLPSFVRMDVEGYEYEIFKGMPKTLKSCVKLLVELHPLPSYILPENLEELYGILEANNFRVKFAVFEHKVKMNLVLRLLWRGAGDKLPIVAKDITISELRSLVESNLHAAAPNVFFEKILCLKQRKENGWSLFCSELFAKFVVCGFDVFDAAFVFYGACVAERCAS